MTFLIISYIFIINYLTKIFKLTFHVIQMESEENKEENLTKEKKKINLTEKVRENPWILSTFVAGILIVILLVTNFSGGITGRVVSESEAAQRLLAYYEANGAEGLIINSVEQITGYKVIFDYFGREVNAFITKDGALGGYLTDIHENIQEPIQTRKVEGSTFEENNDEICTDADGKLYVLLFSTTWCPHCEWIKDTFDGLKKESFADKINLQHWEVDIGDNTLTSKVEKEVPENMLNLYEKYNPRGSIPTFVFGCKYTRIGNGYESKNDLNAELEDFKLIINKLLK